MPETSNYHFDYIKPDEETTKKLEEFRASYKELLSLLCSLPQCRELSLAITHLETSLMYATKTLVVTAPKPEGTAC